MTAQATEVLQGAIDREGLSFADLALTLNTSQRRAAAVVLGAEAAMPAEIAALSAKLGLAAGALDGLLPKAKDKAPPFWLPMLLDKGLLALVVGAALYFFNDTLTTNRELTLIDYNAQLAFLEAQIAATSSLSGLMIGETEAMLTDYRGLMALSEAAKEDALTEEDLVRLAALRASLLASLDVLAAVVGNGLSVDAAKTAVGGLALNAEGADREGITVYQAQTTTALMALLRPVMDRILVQRAAERTAVLGN